MLTPLPPVTVLAGRLRNGRTTAVDLVETCLERIAELDTQLNAFIAVLGASARSRAQDADRELAQGRDRGPLHGIPISLKDLIDLEGVCTSAASRVRSGHRATADAHVAAQLRRSGAVFVGKCNLHEFAFGTTGEDSAFGPTRHPAAPGHSPGGSSSGSAVSVATGMAAVSVGTDTGGSIRIPAAACGLVGLKPAFGELSCQGIVPLAATLDHVGPIGLTVSDTALAYHGMAGRPVDLGATSNPPAPTALRLGLPRKYFLTLLDDDVRGAFEDALDRLGRAGHAVHVVEIPHAETIARVYRETVLHEAWQAHGPALTSQPEAFTPGVRARLGAGRHVTADAYRAAQGKRAVLVRGVDAALAGCDALVLPTLPIPAPPLGADRIAVGEADYGLRELTLRLTQLFNLTGHPAITVPCGVTRAGLPCGAQLAGARGQTLRLLAAAARCEAAIRNW